MKAFLLAVSIACLLVLAGCSDGGSNNGSLGGNGGGGNAGNLQSFVINNCKAMTNGHAMDLDNQQFPADATTDPTQSVYKQNCLGS